MDVAVSREEMDAAFGADHMVRVPLERQNPVVTHEPSKAFLARIGLPDVPDFLFAADDELGSGMTTKAGWEPIEGDYAELSGGTWAILGYFWNDVIVLDGVTGVIRVLDDGAGEIRYLNGGVDLFARYLVALARDLECFDVDLDGEDREAATEAIMAEFREVDPTAFAEPGGYWGQKVAEELAYGY